MVDLGHGANRSIRVLLALTVPRAVPFGVRATDYGRADRDRATRARRRITLSRARLNERLGSRLEFRRERRDLPVRAREPPQFVRIDKQHSIGLALRAPRVDDRAG